MESPGKCPPIGSFLGLCIYYRKLVKGFSNIPKPIHQLNEAKQKFFLTDECESALKRLKEDLTSSLVLTYLQPNRLFILDADSLFLQVFFPLKSGSLQPTNRQTKNASTPNDSLQAVVNSQAAI